MLALAGATTLHAQNAAPATDGTLAQRIERVTGRAEFKHALWGIEFYDLDKKQAIYTLNADKLFTPGSTTKLLTEGTALGVLGPDHRFRTRVYRTGSVAADGTLTGDLVLVASGDPNLSGRMRPDGTLAFENVDHAYDGSPDTRAVPGDPLAVIRSLAKQVASHVKRVRGRVLIDVSLFPEGERELGTRAVISPIVVNDNLIDVTVTSGAAAGAPLALTVSPATAYAKFVSTGTTGAAGSARSVGFSADSTLPDGTHLVTVSGSLPAGGDRVLASYKVPSPSVYARIAFTEALREAGVQVPAPDLKTASPDFKKLASSYTDANSVAEHVSALLMEEAKVTLKVSQNLHASMTPYIIGAIVGKNDENRTGFDIEREFLSKAGLDLDGAHQGDGAGGDAHYSPAFMVSYLEHMSTLPFAKQFLEALPVLGKDGTLWNIQRSSPAAGSVHAKTGTYSIYDPLNRRPLVTGKGLAGYISTSDGRRLAFAIYVNNVAVPAEPDAITRIIGQAMGEVAAAAYVP
jgi:PBP4 family serine-type D-alanyl-D-alanine carboxypeptidase